MKIKNQWMLRLMVDYCLRQLSHRSLIHVVVVFSAIRPGKWCLVSAKHWSGDDLKEQIGRKMMHSIASCAGGTRMREGSALSDAARRRWSGVANKETELEGTREHSGVYLDDHQHSSLQTALSTARNRVEKGQTFTSTADIRLVIFRNKIISGKGHLWTVSERAVRLWRDHFR